MRLVLLALLLPLSAQARQTLVLAQAGSAPAASTDNVAIPTVLAVSINGRPAGDAVLLRTADGTLLAAGDDWARWRLVTPARRVFEFEGARWYALADASGYAAQVDEAGSSLALSFAADAFVPNQRSLRPSRLRDPQPPPGLGGFLNYDVVGVQQSIADGDPQRELSGTLEAGVFNGWGVGTSQWLGRNLSGEDNIASQPREVVRLESAWTRDFPDTMETLRVGDAIGASGLWGRPVRYGGLRWSRNFGTQPGFLTLPQPALAGESALPSVVEVYVDGARRGQFDLPPGPFSLNEVPVVNGQGEVQLVVRDLLGREQRISEPYIVGNRQLRAGLHDFSWEGGFAREGFGRESSDYGDAFVSTTHRYGFSDAFTGEARLEGSAEVQAVGLGAIYSLERIGTFSGALVGSHSDAGVGALNSLSFQRILRRRFSLGARLELASAEFAQLGLAAGANRARRTIGANAGFSVQPYGNAGLGYLRQERADGSEVALLTGTYSLGLRQASLNLTLSHRIEPSDDLSVAAVLRLPFFGRDRATLGHRHREPDDGPWSTESFARVQRSLPGDEGIGYRLGVTQTRIEDGAADTLGEAGFFHNARYASYSLEAASNGERDTYRAGIEGGFGAMAGTAFASRKINDSFGLVDTGVPDMELRLNNRVAGRTNADGIAVLPRLFAYQDNTVRVNAEDLPLDVELERSEIQAVPYFRSGVLIRLPARSVVGALVTLRQADGSPVPAGAVVEFDGRNFPVGKDGRAYLTGLRTGTNPAVVRWNGTRCKLGVELPPRHDFQPDLGTLTCAATH